MKIYVKDVEKGVRVRPESRSLRRFCQAWLDYMIKYEKRVPDDFPFWYGERPLIGFLAAAIWDSGSVCMEEYEAERKADKKADGTTLGRGDLYIAHGTSDGGWEGNVEFKRRGIGISQTSHFAKFLKSKWERSEADAGTWHGPKEVRRLGGMFLCPYVGRRTDIRQYNENLRHLLTLAWDTIKPDVLAWWCPVKRVMATDEPSKKDWVVGVILLIKQVK